MIAVFKLIAALFFITITAFLAIVFGYSGLFTGLGLSILASMGISRRERDRVEAKRHAEIIEASRHH